jgi:hypothetical protein
LGDAVQNIQIKIAARIAEKRRPEQKNQSSCFDSLIVVFVDHPPLESLPKNTQVLARSAEFCYCARKE